MNLPLVIFFYKHSFILMYFCKLPSLQIINSIIMHTQVEENTYFLNQMDIIQKELNRIKFIKQKVNDKKYLQNINMLLKNNHNKLSKTTCRVKNMKNQSQLFEQNKYQVSQANCINLSKTNYADFCKKDFYNDNPKKSMVKKKQQNHFRIKKQKESIQLMKKKQNQNNKLKLTKKMEKYRRLKRIGQIKFNQYINIKLNQILQEKQMRKQQKLDQTVGKLKQKINYQESQWQKIQQFQKLLLLKQKLVQALLIKKTKSQNNFEKSLF